MAEKTKILFINHEMEPYTKLTSLGVLAHDIPKKLQERGNEIRVFMPRFGKINERRHRLHEVIRLSGINIQVGEEDHPMIIKVASLPTAKMQIYFIDNDDFFKRKAYFHDDKDKFFTDNDERIVFYNKGVIEILLKLGWVPDIIHCTGWMSSLVPFFARVVYKGEPVFNKSKFVVSVHEKTFEDKLGKNFLKTALLNGKSEEYSTILENPGCCDLFYCGITFADGIINTSELTDRDLVKYIDKQDKPKLNTFNIEEPEKLISSYESFYDEVLASK